jgi:hypothetical protein
VCRFTLRAPGGDVGMEMEDGIGTRVEGGMEVDGEGEAVEEKWEEEERTWRCPRAITFVQTTRKWRKVKVVVSEVSRPSFHAHVPHSNMPSDSGASIPGPTRPGQLRNTTTSNPRWYPFPDDQAYSLVPLSSNSPLPPSNLHAPRLSPVQDHEPESSIPIPRFTRPLHKTPLSP